MKVVEVHFKAKDDAFFSVGTDGVVAIEETPDFHYIVTKHWQFAAGVTATTTIRVLNAYLVYYETVKTKGRKRKPKPTA